MAVAFITGASSGIGAALALEYAKRGFQVALLARRLSKLEKVAADVESLGQQCLVVETDVRSPESLRNAVKKTLAHFGRIDTVIANAGFGFVGEIEKLSLEDIRSQFSTNIEGVISTFQATLPALRESRGKFGILGSANGYIPLAGHAPYCMSKFAVRALARSLWHEMKPSGVSVTLLTVGFVSTEIRRVDNQGVWRPENRDPIPAWLRMPAATAAKIIARGVEGRRREKYVTFHGWLVSWAERVFPDLVAHTVQTLGIRGRPEPKSPHGQATSPLL